MGERPRLLRGLAQSLLAHALLLGVALLLLRDRRFEAPRSKLAGPISVGFVHGAPHASGSKAETPKTKVQKIAKKPSLTLGPNFGLSQGGVPLSQPPSTQSGSGPGGGGQDGPRDGYEVSNAMDIQEESRLYPFFSALWKKIDTSTGYPNDFVKERVTGYVTAQLVVDHRGVFTGSIAKVNSDQPLLETYAMAVLLHALSEPLPRELWSDRAQIILVSRFDFHTFTWGEVPPARVQKEVKNVLEFERYGYTDPKVNQVIEKFVTHYLPPIIPLPGAFYVDFFRLYEFLHNVNNHKMEEDELRLERIELKREQWENMIHSGAVPDTH